MTAKPIQPPRKATIFINKLEAARRQLNAAIRMTFANEDELAIHTVAAAAYRIVRDLLEKRGRFDIDELVVGGIYDAARSLAAGELQQAELDDLTYGSSYLRDVLVDLADEIQSKGNDFTIDKIKVHMSRDKRIAEWNRLSYAANFLKHADKDTDKHLSLDKIDNDELLIRACASYVMVFQKMKDAIHNPTDILHQTPEMSAFHVWWMSRHDPDWLRREHGDEFADLFQRLSPSRQRRACFKLIRLFTKWRSESHAPPS